VEAGCPDMGKKDSSVSVRVPSALSAELAHVAEIEGRSVGDIIRRAVVAHYGLARRLAPAADGAGAE